MIKPAETAFTVTSSMTADEIMLTYLENVKKYLEKAEARGEPLSEGAKIFGIVSSVGAACASVAHLRGFSEDTSFELCEDLIRRFRDSFAESLARRNAERH